MKKDKQKHASLLFPYPVFNDGTGKELLNISGTIPVSYKSKYPVISFSKHCKYVCRKFLGLIFHWKFADNTYHIPICIWLMDTHPYNAPLAYVQPTSDMQIKVSMFVDHNGRIYLPYLHEWNPVSDSIKFARCSQAEQYFYYFDLSIVWSQSSSDLLGLIQVMIVTFGEMPPVYAKPKESVSPYPPQCRSIQFHRIRFQHYNMYFLMLCYSVYATARR